MCSHISAANCFSGELLRLHAAEPIKKLPALIRSHDLPDEVEIAEREHVEPSRGDAPDRAASDHRDAGQVASIWLHEAQVCVGY